MPSVYTHTEIGEAESSQDTFLRNTTPIKKRRRVASKRSGAATASKKTRLNECQKHFNFLVRGRQMDKIQEGILDQLDQVADMATEVQAEVERNDELLPLIEEMKVAAHELKGAKERLSVAGSEEVLLPEVDDLLGSDPEAQWTDLEGIHKQKSDKLLQVLQKIEAVNEMKARYESDMVVLREDLQKEHAKNCETQATLEEKLKVSEAENLELREKIKALNGRHARDLIQERNAAKVQGMLAAAAQSRSPTRQGNRIEERGNGDDWIYTIAAVSSGCLKEGPISEKAVKKLHSQIQDWNSRRPTWAESDERRCANSFVGKKKSGWTRKDKHFACSSCASKGMICVAVHNGTIELLPLKDAVSSRGGDVGEGDEEFWFKAI